MNSVKQFQNIYKNADKSIWFKGQMVQSDVRQSEFHSLVLKTKIIGAEFADVIFSKVDLEPIYRLKSFPIKTEIVDKNHATLTTDKGLKFTFEISTVFTTQPKVEHIEPKSWKPTKEDLIKIKACTEIVKPSYFQHEKYSCIKFDVGKMFGLSSWTAIYFDVDTSKCPNAIPIEVLPYMGGTIYHNDSVSGESFLRSELKSIEAICIVKHDLMGVPWENVESIFHNQGNEPRLTITASKSEWLELANTVKGLTNAKNKRGLTVSMSVDKDCTVSATLRKDTQKYVEIPFEGVASLGGQPSYAFVFKPELLRLHLASMSDERVTIECHGTSKGHYRPLKITSEFGFRIIMPCTL